MPSKIIETKQFNLIKALKDRGKVIVFTNGCFDILHPGHKYCLQEAQKLGDVLVVGVNSDSSVKKLKGAQRPVNPLQRRMNNLAILEMVNFVIAFDEDTPLELIKAIEPHILVKGGDYLPEQMIGKSLVEKYGGKVVIVPLLPGFSTTNIISQKR